MALPNAWYIDENAIHKPSVSRLLSYGLTTGKFGVLGTTDCAIKALGTPGAAIQAMPGAYNVPAKHLGGSYESYAGSWDVAEQVSVSAVGSAGSRSDLVILRAENPYVSGSGTWSTPLDPAEGPYMFVRVIENVANTVWDVAQVNDTWSAVTLSRIDRPANTGIVEQSHITDLRSLAALGGTRTVIVTNPPTTPPPIAQAYYMQFKESASDPNYGNPTGGSDNQNDLLVADTATKNWPREAVWQNIAVPDWAVECDAEMVIYNAQIQTNDCYGKLWLDFGGTTTTFQTYAIDYTGQPGRHNIGYGKTFTIPSSLRGKVITVRAKAASYYTAPGRLSAKSGTTTKLSLNFQRVPDA